MNFEEFLSRVHTFLNGTYNAGFSRFGRVSDSRFGKFEIHFHDRINNYYATVIDYKGLTERAKNFQLIERVLRFIDSNKKGNDLGRLIVVFNEVLTKEDKQYFDGAILKTFGNLDMISIKDDTDLKKFEKAEEKRKMLALLDPNISAERMASLDEQDIKNTRKIVFNRPDESSVEWRVNLKSHLESQRKKYYAVGAKWGHHDQLKRFIENGIWENGDAKLSYVVDRVKEGDILVVKSTYPGKGTGYLRVKAIGLVLKNNNDGQTLGVSWGYWNGSIDIPGRLSKLRHRIAEITIDDFFEILDAINAIDQLYEKGLFERLPHNIGFAPESKIANTISDEPYGEDYFDIDKDVLAFSKVIASKSFKPPLAIALFGKWGMGKSFFMEKLRCRIERIASSQVESNEALYCRGIAQIHFNAWSYMDANLWASIVTRIFEGLQDYIDNDSKANREKKAIEEELSKSLNVIKEEREVIEIKKASYEDEIELLKIKRKSLEEDLNGKIDEIKNASLQQLVKQIDDEINLKEKINEALNSNLLIQEFKQQLDEIVPEEYRMNPNLAIDQLKSNRTFLRELIRDKKVRCQLIIGLIALMVVLIVPWCKGPLV